MVPHAQQLISLAAGYIGLKEIPMGSNDAPWLRALLKGSEWMPGEAYCLFGAVACLAHVCGGYDKLPAHIELDGSCSDASALAEEYCSRQAARAQLQGKLGSSPATGCIGLLKGGVRTHYHAIIVVSIDQVAGTIETIEFNHADMCCRASRTIGAADYLTW